MKSNVLQDKSYAVALRIIKIYQCLCNDKKEYVLSKQLLRSGTSIGANIEEAIYSLMEAPEKKKQKIGFRRDREEN